MDNRRSSWSVPADLRRLFERGGSTAIETPTVSFRPAPNVSIQAASSTPSTWANAITQRGQQDDHVMEIFRNPDTPSYNRNDNGTEWTQGMWNNQQRQRQDKNDMAPGTTTDTGGGQTFPAAPAFNPQAQPFNPGGKYNFNGDNNSYSCGQSTEQTLQPQAALNGSQSGTSGVFGGIDGDSVTKPKLPFPDWRNTATESNSNTSAAGNKNEWGKATPFSFTGSVKNTWKTTVGFSAPSHGNTNEWSTTVPSFTSSGTSAWNKSVGCSATSPGNKTEWSTTTPSSFANSGTNTWGSPITSSATSPSEWNPTKPKAHFSAADPFKKRGKSKENERKTNTSAHETSVTSQDNNVVSSKHGGKNKAKDTDTQGIEYNADANLKKPQVLEKRKQRFGVPDKQEEKPLLDKYTSSDASNAVDLTDYSTTSHLSIPQRFRNWPVLGEWNKGESFQMCPESIVKYRIETSDFDDCEKPALDAKGENLLRSYRDLLVKRYRRPSSFERSYGTKEQQEGAEALRHPAALLMTIEHLFCRGILEADKLYNSEEIELIPFRVPDNGISFNRLNDFIANRVNGVLTDYNQQHYLKGARNDPLVIDIVERSFRYYALAIYELPEESSVDIIQEISNIGKRLRGLYDDARERSETWASIRKLNLQSPHEAEFRSACVLVSCVEFVRRSSTRRYVDGELEKTPDLMLQTDEFSVVIDAIRAAAGKRIHEYVKLMKKASPLQALLMFRGFQVLQLAILADVNATSTSGSLNLKSLKIMLHASCREEVIQLIRDLKLENYEECGQDVILYPDGNRGGPVPDRPTKNFKRPDLIPHVHEAIKSRSAFVNADRWSSAYDGVIFGGDQFQLTPPVDKRRSQSMANGIGKGRATSDKGHTNVEQSISHAESDTKTSSEQSHFHFSREAVKSTAVSSTNALPEPSKKHVITTKKSTYTPQAMPTSEVSPITARGSIGTSSIKVGSIDLRGNIDPVSSSSAFVGTTATANAVITGAMEDVVPKRYDIVPGALVSSATSLPSLPQNTQVFPYGTESRAAVTSSTTSPFDADSKDNVQSMDIHSTQHAESSPFITTTIASTTVTVDNKIDEVPRALSKDHASQESETTLDFTAIVSSTYSHSSCHDKGFEAHTHGYIGQSEVYVANSTPLSDTDSVAPDSPASEARVPPQFHWLDKYSMEDELLQHSDDDSKVLSHGELRESICLDSISWNSEIGDVPEGSRMALYEFFYTPSTLANGYTSLVRHICHRVLGLGGHPSMDGGTTLSLPGYRSLTVYDGGHWSRADHFDKAIIFVNIVVPSYIQCSKLNEKAMEVLEGIFSGMNARPSTDCMVLCFWRVETCNVPIPKLEYSLESLCQTCTFPGYAGVFDLGAISNVALKSVALGLKGLILQAVRRPHNPFFTNANKELKVNRFVQLCANSFTQSIRPGSFLSIVARWNNYVELLKGSIHHARDKWIIEKLALPLPENCDNVVYQCAYVLATYATEVNNVMSLSGQMLLQINPDSSWEEIDRTMCSGTPLLTELWQPVVHVLCEWRHQQYKPHYFSVLAFSRILDQIIRLLFEEVGMQDELVHINMLDGYRCILTAIEKCSKMQLNIPKKRRIRSEPKLRTSAKKFKMELSFAGTPVQRKQCEYSVGMPSSKTLNRSNGNRLTGTSFSRSTSSAYTDKLNQLRDLLNKEKLECNRFDRVVGLQ